MKSVHQKAMQRKPALTLAQRADRFTLYQRSVQDVQRETEFLECVFREKRNRAALFLREDFCGTALLACEWVRRNRLHTAMGVDLDPEVLAWSRQHNLIQLAPSQADRLTLKQADVLAVDAPAVDLLVAFNFSYWVFKQREQLRAYFQAVRQSLVPDGLFMLDAYGGYDAYRQMSERQKLGRFTYVWEQAAYDPISGHTTCHIHFSFPDGSRLRRAFTYHWRLWSLPEIRELLAEAGFKRIGVYLEGWDESSNEGNGIFQPAEHGEADAAWIAYLVAEP